ncbi:HAD family hydrolase [Sulfurimonas sp. HSL-3221]|uniref:HAD family hydrolase n=1 Tax=Sulfurimonadaceae TaxID=2771471 RepID=UPI001E467137|nr:HAD family hydrolase [Sulfurimonas sp. HSL-3221]UFS62719.1 HAD family hydrolase [Sulfurimonas sp. HSL-3221]
MTILFDLDGTLIDSTEAILESFHRTFEVLGGEHPSDAEIKALIGHTLDDMYLRVGIAPEAVEAYVRTYKEHYRRISTLKTVLLPQAREAIEAASAVARLGIVTTKTGLYSRELMEHFGVMDAFEVLIGREDVTHAKPHPEPVLTALERMGGDPARSWLIGDTRLDAEAARRAGVSCVGVLSGYDNEEQLRLLTPFIEKNALEAVRYIANKGRNVTF